MPFVLAVVFLLAVLYRDDVLLFATLVRRDVLLYLLFALELRRAVVEEERLVFAILLRLNVFPVVFLP